MPTTKPKPSLYQLKITLLGIEPPIWRRIQVPSKRSWAGPIATFINSRRTENTGERQTTMNSAISKSWTHRKSG